MPATVTIRRWTGSAGGPTKNDVTGINTRLIAEDLHSTAVTTNPIQVPTGGTNYSYWASFRLSCDVAPSSVINNIRWFTDGTNSLGAGIGLNIASGASSYTQATGTAGTTGDALSTSAYVGMGGPTNAFSYTSGSPLAISGTTTTTGDFGVFVALQIAVTTDASPGNSGSETVTWRYDEV